MEINKAISNQNVIITLKGRLVTNSITFGRFSLTASTQTIGIILTHFQNTCFNIMYSFIQVLKHKNYTTF